METDKVIAFVYQTSDYRKFKKLPANRGVTANRVRKLIESFQIREVLNPIVVNKNFEIIDGQGRFEAKRLLKRPISYIIDEEATLDECRLLNRFTQKWTEADSVQSFANEGNENYIRLMEVRKATGKPIGLILRLANKGSNTSHGAATNKIHSGEITFSKKDQDKVEELLVYAEEIRDALEFEKRTNNAFFTAVKIMVETDGYSHSRMLTNCKQEKLRYSQMSNLEDQLRQFSKIYNRDKRQKNHIYFEDYMRNRGHNVRSYDQVQSPYDAADVSTLKKKAPESGNSAEA